MLLPLPQHLSVFKYDEFIFPQAWLSLQNRILDIQGLCTDSIQTQGQVAQRSHPTWPPISHLDWDLDSKCQVNAVNNVVFLSCPLRAYLRSATLTWPWRPPECSLATSLHRLSTRISSRSRIPRSQRGRRKAAQRAPPSCQISTLPCKLSASRPSTLQETQRAMPTSFEKSETPPRTRILVRVPVPPLGGAVLQCPNKEDKDGAHQASASWSLSSLSVWIAVVWRIVLLWSLHSDKGQC